MPGEKKASAANLVRSRFIQPGMEAIDETHSRPRLKPDGLTPRPYPLPRCRLSIADTRSTPSSGVIAKRRIPREYPTHLVGPFSVCRELHLAAGASHSANSWAGMARSIIKSRKSGRSRSGSSAVSVL